ncbi:MAG TPA: PQQ-binding-like beta-propeller repeat protein, partial [Planctomycetota bacterium]|nr:PQQ-binding-like beta-propeller repeat protein [Planctomycetota bacterium]
NVIRATPLVDGTDVFAASADGTVTRLLARKGFVPGTSWQRTTGSRIVTDLASYSRWVFAGSTDYKLYCLESQDGSSYWTFAAEAPVEDPPVIYSFQSNQEYVYCIATEKTARAENRTLFSLKLTSGDLVWRVPGVRKIVSIGKRTLYVLNDPKAGEKESLVAIDVLSGKEKFRISIRGFNFIPTNMADHGRNQRERGRIYLVAEDGTIQTIGERL